MCYMFEGYFPAKVVTHIAVEHSNIIMNMDME